VKKISLLLFLSLFVSVLSGCGPAPTVPTTTATIKPTAISSPIVPLIPTQTIELRPTIAPDPIPPQPNRGDIFYVWGGDSDTYQVWINNLEQKCKEWVCPNNNSNYLFNNSWVYAGQAKGNATFHFPFPARDIVISWGNKGAFAFDSIFAIVGDQTIGYGYTLGGEPSVTWMDSGHFLMSTLKTFDYPNCRSITPCGILGQETDNNYSITGSDGSGILFRFIGKSCAELDQIRLAQTSVDVGAQAYQINGITIIAKPISQLGPKDVVCP
jgi:hypothetical protein